MKKIFRILGVIIGIILFDQITKGILLYMITGTIPVAGYAWNIVPVPYLMWQVCDIFNIVFTWNPGSAFSLFRTIGDALPIIMIGLTSVLIGGIIFYLLKRAQHYEKIPLAMIVGGALGNFIDRIRFGAVIDFLDFHIGGWHWPAFNVGDVFITLGVCLYVLNLYIARRRCLNNVKGK